MEYKPRRKLTREFKLEAVRLIRDRGLSYAQASKDLVLEGPGRACVTAAGLGEEVRGGSSAFIPRPRPLIQPGGVPVMIPFRANIRKASNCRYSSFDTTVGLFDVAGTGTSAHLTRRDNRRVGLYIVP